MLERVLPLRIDNSYRGPKLVLWLFVLILIVKTGQNLSVLFGGASVLSSADGIPVDSYPQPAAQTIVSVWALLALTRLVICLLCFLVVVRYRSVMPFMLGLLLFHDIGRLCVFHFFPIVRVGTPPGPTVNFVLMVLTIVGLALSQWPQRNPSAQSA